MSNDAAFREALDAAIREAFHLGQSSSTDATALSTLATRVLALYAERQGEVYEVRLDQAGDPVALLDRTYNPGDRVRVVREEAK